MPIPTISESEWVVASIVWERTDLTASEIAERLPRDTRWKLKTVNTFLARLVAKGVLEANLDGRAFRYRALISKEQCVRGEGESFLRRVFGGAVAPMLAHFVESSDLNAEEIAELRRMLQRKANSNPSGTKPK
jgi:BlaI family penicillinase repressor